MTTELEMVRGRVASLLADTSYSDWAADDLDAAIRMALDELSLSLPAVADTVIEAVDDQREYDLSAVDGLVDVIEVWYPYLADDEDYSSARPVSFRMLDRFTLYLGCADNPDASYDLRIFYTTRHTLEGLDSATATTLSADEKAALVVGAAGYAAIAKARELMNQVTMGTDVPRALQQWGEQRLAEFSRRVHRMWEAVALGADARVGGWS
ncbi:MAG: hypothetical protein H5T63_08875 [Chloroflexi bacterium]|nr:hypothetical protein [Chloroflexota bacterium]